MICRKTRAISSKESGKRSQKVGLLAGLCYAPETIRSACREYIAATRSAEILTAGLKAPGDVLYGMMKSIAAKLTPLIAWAVYVARCGGTQAYVTDGSVTD